MTHLSDRDHHIAMQRALADNMRALVRLGEDARQGRTSPNVQQWARIFAASLESFTHLIPLLGHDYFSDANLTAVITTTNQVQGGLIKWLAPTSP